MGFVGLHWTEECLPTSFSKTSQANYLLQWINLNSTSISLLEKAEMGSFIFIFPLNLRMRLEENTPAIDIDASSSFMFSF